MKRLMSVLFLSILFSPTLIARAKHPTAWKDLEQQILLEHNRVRRDPESYIPLLETWLENTDEQGRVRLSPTTQLQTMEGRRAIREAIAYLKKQSRSPKLSHSKRLKKVAQHHAQYLRAGFIGHNGKNGQSPKSRFLAFGRPVGAYGENISYGFRTPEAILMGLIINDGNPRRGHRKNVFESRYRKAGVGCNDHKEFGLVCVITYATDFRK